MSFNNTPHNIPFLPGGGEMGELIRSKDWSKTTLGTPDTWPQSLRTTLSIILNSKFPMFLIWGPELICFYNDAYRPSLGNSGKHPSILGSPAEDYWQEIWSDIKPLIDHVLAGGEANWSVDQLLPIYRNDKIEDVYWTFSYSAVNDESGKPAGVFITCNETTEKVLALKKEDQFRVLADQAPLWVWMADKNINIEYANPQVLDFLGITNYAEFTGQVWQASVHPEDIPLVFESFREAISQQKSFEFECRIKHAATGEFEWFYIKSVPRFEGNNLAGFIGTGVNINQQRNQLLALMESEEQFHMLAETLPQLVWVTDEFGNQEFASAKWEEYTGTHPQGEADWEDIVHPDDIEGITKAWLHCLATGDVYKYDIRLRNKKGEYRWFTVNGEPVLNTENKIIKWVGAFTDIHTEKEFAQELEKQVEARTNELQNVNEILLQKNELLTISENFNRTLTEVSPTLVYIHDIEKNRPVFLNSTYLKFIGYDWETVEALGEKFFDLVIHPDDIISLREMTEKIKASQPGEVFESNSHRKNAKGEWVPFLNRLTAFKRNSENEVTQIIGMAIDISELKHAKDILQQKNIDLENMNKELQSFAYVSSHDLQEPLRKIQTFATRIIEKEYNNLSENGKNYFNRMQSAAARMQQLIQDLLAFSRVNLTERKFEKTDLNTIVEEVKDELKEELQQKNAVVETVGLSPIHIIPFQFRQLMHNLISNSLKFSKPENTPIIQIFSEIGKGINFNNPKLSPEQKYCHIVVKDNGIGFHEEYNEKVFDVFQRLHGKSEFTGTGIGLAIVKKIVENHNGIIVASGAIDQGATFDIYIPTSLSSI